MTRSPTILDQKFWAKFAKQTWEKKALFLPQVQTPIAEMGEHQIFVLLVRFADHCRKLKETTGFKFYVDGHRLHEDEFLDLLPHQKDKSLQGYHARMNEIFEDYCLVCDELLQVSQDHQTALAQFTNDLYRSVGFPNRFAEMGLYLGNYKKTPFGVHVDGCGVFSFPVAGIKKFRIWKSEFVKKNPGLDRAFKYDRYKKHSQLLIAQPGDMTYWPSSAWHIAESDGSFSATWSLGVWIDRPYGEIVTEVLHRILQKNLGRSTTELGMTSFTELHDRNGRVNDVPPIYRKTIQALKKISEKEIEAQFKKIWMQQISKQGFKSIPKNGSTNTNLGKLQLRSLHSPILWQTSGPKLICGFAGVIVETPKSRSLVALIKALNAGQICLPKDFLDPKTRARDTKFLQQLKNAGAFSNS